MPCPARSSCCPSRPAQGMLSTHWRCGHGHKPIAGSQECTDPGHPPLWFPGICAVLVQGCCRLCYLGGVRHTWVWCCGRVPPLVTAGARFEPLAAVTCPLQQSVTWSHQEMPQNGQTLTMLMLSPHLPPPLTSHAVGHHVPPPQKVAVLPSADASFLPRAFLSKGHRDRAGLWLAPCGTWPVLRSRGCPVHSPKALQGTNREPWSCLSGHRAGCPHAAVSVAGRRC